MADYVVPADSRTIRFTTTPNVVDTVTFEANVGTVEILSDGAGDVWFTVNGPAPVAPGDGGASVADLLPAGSPAIDTVGTLGRVAGDVVRVLSPVATSVIVKVAR